MSAKYSKTTAEPISWDKATYIIDILGMSHPKKAMFVACGIYLGLRVGDLLTLTYEMIESGRIVITEEKTGKTKVVAVNKKLQEVIQKHKQGMGKIFTSYKGKVLSRQHANVMLHGIAKRFKIESNFSCHSLRKTMGRHVWEMDGQSDRALIHLSQIFNHTSTSMTRRYLGITDKEITDIYLNL